MTKRTKKVGPSGRFGARYGVRIRKRIADVEIASKGRHECPKCKIVAMQRTANGIYSCRHCGARMASSSYMPTPPAAIKRELAEVLAKAEEKVTGVEVAEEVIVEAPAEKETEPKAKPKKRVKKTKKE